MAVKITITAGANIGANLEIWSSSGGTFTFFTGATRTALESGYYFEPPAGATSYQVRDNTGTCSGTTSNTMTCSGTTTTSTTTAAAATTTTTTAAATTTTTTIAATTTTTTTIEATTTTTTTIAATTTTTTTIAATTTTTTTAGVEFQYWASDSYIDPYTACAQGVNDVLFMSEASLGTGIYVYTDSNLTLPFDGNDEWWNALDTDSVTYYAIRVSDVGYITDIMNCAATTTTTTTTAPGATTTTTTTAATTTTTTTSPDATTTTTTTAAAATTTTTTTAAATTTTTTTGSYVYYVTASGETCSAVDTTPYYGADNAGNPEYDISLIFKLYDSPTLIGSFLNFGEFTVLGWSDTDTGNAKYNGDMNDNGEIGSQTPCPTPTTTTTTTPAATTTTTTTITVADYTYYVTISGETCSAVDPTPYYGSDNAGNPEADPLLVFKLYDSPTQPFSGTFLNFGVATSVGWSKSDTGNATHNGDINDNGEIGSQTPCPTPTTTTTTTPAATTTTTTTITVADYTYYVTISGETCSAVDPTPYYGADNAGNPETDPLLVFKLYESSTQPFSGSFLNFGVATSVGWSKSDTGNATHNGDINDNGEIGSQTTCP